MDLTVHTVGFRVDQDARADLQCIAEATGGTYADADSADSLNRALLLQVQHAVSGYAAEGTRVAGSAAQDQSAPLLEEGQYVDTPEKGGANIARDGTRKYYRLDLPEGWTAHASATLSVPPDASDDDGSAMNVYSTFMDSSGICGGTGYGQVNWAQGVNLPAVAVGDSTGCGAPLYLEVSRSGNKFMNTAATVEIVIRYEPPADTTGLPAPQVVGVPEPPAHGGAPTALDGGLSFNQASELIPGQTYESSIVAGELRYFKVPVTWGQQIAWRLDITGRDGPSTERNTMRLHWFNPLREENYDMTQYASYAPDYETESATGGSDEPVRYGSEKFGYDGDYYLVVESPPAQETSAYQQTFTLTVTTPGEVEAGPSYDLSAAQTPAAQTPQSSPAASSTAASQQSGATAAADSSGGMSPIIWVGIGALVVIGAGAAWMVARRRGDSAAGKDAAS